MFSKEFKGVMEELKTNALYKDVIEDIADEFDMDDEQLLAVLDDVTSHGCASGCVPSMIYCEDTVKFYEKHKHDINKELAFLCEPAGIPMWEFFKDFDESDVLCLDYHNQNLISWWVYEHICGELWNELNNL